ncbi:MAG: hypothetical protein JXR94_12420 [Candidatus Hydrogenedentes bacterium]|nr:hypothetical protein [Candidatus Hydrogenedentota bacterium]
MSAKSTAWKLGIVAFVFCAGVVVGLGAAKGFDGYMTTFAFLDSLQQAEDYVGKGDYPSAIGALYYADTCNPSSFEPNLELARAYDRLACAPLAQHQYRLALHKLEEDTEPLGEEPEWARPIRVLIEERLKDLDGAAADSADPGVATSL